MYTIISATTASTVVADASSAADTTAGSANAGSSTATFTAATTDEFSLVVSIAFHATMCIIVACVWLVFGLYIPLLWHR